MPMLTKRTYWYDATILRDGRRVKRQGTINSSTDVSAINTVERMAKDIWKKPLVHIELYQILDSGELDLCITSSWGDDQAKSLLVPEKNESRNDVYYMPPYNETPAWYPASIGKWFTPDTFAVLKLK